MSIRVGRRLPKPCGLGANCVFAHHRPIKSEQVRCDPTTAFAVCGVRTGSPPTPKKRGPTEWRGLSFWSWWRGLNPRPADYESAALPLSHTSIKLTGYIVPHLFLDCNTFFEIFQKRASFYDAPTNHVFAVIKNHRLSGRDRTLRLIKGHTHAIVIDLLNDCRLCSHIVSDFCLHFHW